MSYWISEVSQKYHTRRCIHVQGFPRLMTEVEHKRDIPAGRRKCNECLWLETDEGTDDE